MIGLAKLAWVLAYHRAWGLDPVADCGRDLPWQTRRCAWGGMGSAHREYYAICDRIARGEQP